MDVYGYALFWSATACVVAAVVVCTLVIRYGFTRDPDLAGRWGWRPTRVGHGLAAALFGTGIVLAILALTAVPIGGKEGNPGLGHALRVRLEALRGRLGDFEHAVARLGEDGARRMRAERAPETVADMSRRMPMPDGGPDVSRRMPIADGGRAIVGSAPIAPRQPASSVDARSSDRRERRAARPEVRSVVAAAPPTPLPPPVAIVPPAPTVTVTPPPIAPPRIARPDVPTSTPAVVERAQAQDRDAVGKPDGHDADLGKRRDRDVEPSRPSERDSDSKAGKDGEFGTPREKPEKRDKRERTTVADAKALRPGLIERFDRSDRPTVDRVERPDRVDRDRVDRPDRTDRPDRIERPDRVERPERPDRVERPDRIERPTRIEIERPPKIEKFERVERGGKR